jgi:hypothetical protein
MTTINLQQEKKENESRFTSTAGGNGGVIFSLGILIFTFLTLIGLNMYVPYAQKNSDALAANVQTESEKLVGLKSLERVVDMQKRLTEIKNNLQISDGAVNRLEMTKILDQLSGELNTNIVVTDFKYDNGGVTVTFNAFNFGDIAKQILNFKKSSYFSGVGVSSIKNEDGLVTCVVTMNVKI